MKNSVNITIALTLIIAIFGLIGCNGSSDIIDPPSINEYQLNGVYVQDVNLALSAVDYNFLAIQMERDSINLNSAQMFYHNDALVYEMDTLFNDSVYTFDESPQIYRPAGSYILFLADSVKFSDTIPNIVTDSIWFNNFPDPQIPNPGGQEITVGWASAANIEGYVVAVVLSNSAYAEVGYSAYVTELCTSTIIPPDAFRANFTNSLDTGWYDIYVYGFTGSPDSALSSKVLPVSLPSQLSDNIDHNRLGGNFGFVTVSRKIQHRVSQ